MSAQWSGNAPGACGVGVVRADWALYTSFSFRDTRWARPGGSGCVVDALSPDRPDRRLGAGQVAAGGQVPGAGGGIPGGPFPALSGDARRADAPGRGGGGFLAVARDFQLPAPGDRAPRGEERQVRDLHAAGTADGRGDRDAQSCQRHRDVPRNWDGRSPPVAARPRPTRATWPIPKLPSASSPPCWQTGDASIFWSTTPASSATGSSSGWTRRTGRRSWTRTSMVPSTSAGPS